jgi:hypothetical protein
MAKFSEETLSTWTKPPSGTEETKLLNSEKMVKEAIKEDDKLSKFSIDTFGQGSYANDTNVRLNSDIDINVCYTDGFYFALPQGKSRVDFGIGGPSTYSFSEFKNDVETALIKKFTKENIKRKDKCITIIGNSYRIKTDVVPTWNHRRYSEDGNYVIGTYFMSDKEIWTKNYPKQHIENGKSKNSNTYKRFKRLTRIYRKLRYKMLDDGETVNDGITSFLLESLVWNVPNSIFNDYDSWSDRLKYSIAHLYTNTEKQEDCKNWGEVSELLYLFHSYRNWNRVDVNNFLLQTWNYLELK